MKKLSAMEKPSNSVVPNYLFLKLGLSALFGVLLSCNISLAQMVSPDLGHCQLKNQSGLQKHYECQMKDSPKKLAVLDLYGPVAKTAYYHGYFLRHEIENGVLLGVQTEKRRALAALDESERKQFDTLSRCVLRNYRGSVSNEFLDMVYQQHRGMKEAGSRIEKKDLLEAHFMLELSIYFDSIVRRLENEPRQARKDLINNCAGIVAVNKITDILKKVSGGLRKIKMGCTGVATSAAQSHDGSLVLGRNFDTGLLGFFERYPMVLIQNNPNGIRSVGAAAAGLHYAGGISGFNNYGLVASLHQLSSEDAVQKHEPFSSDTAPYLMNRLLNEATTLEQAIQIMKDKKGFGAWTMFLGDSKTDELASVELAGAKVVVARRNQGCYMGQANHYLAPLTQEGGYEYSLNKTLESVGRLQWVSQNLEKDQGRIDAQWVINMLSGHTDAFVGQRSFGRTTTKVYTAATHVMVPARQELWMTLGETYPTNQGRFIGLRFPSTTSGEFEIFAQTWAQREYSQENWYQSQGDYVRAYMAQADNLKSLPQTEIVLGHLNQAVIKAQKDDIVEFPYHYIRARVLMLKSALSPRGSAAQEEALLSALADFKILEQADQAGQARMHAYEKGLVGLWKSRALRLSSQKSLQAQADSTLRLAQEDLLPLQREYSTHVDFNKFLRTMGTPLSFADVLKEKIEMPTIE